MDQSGSISLAEKMRPDAFDALVFTKNAVLENLVKMARDGRYKSVVVFGPPGVGKTSFINLLLSSYKGPVERLNAVDVSVSDLRKRIRKAQEHFYSYSVATAFTIDEAHRLSSAQQDALLPALEDGSVKLFAATTETPSLKFSRAFLSRVVLLEMRSHDEASLQSIVQKACLALNLDISESFALALIKLAQGDARRLLQSLEVAMDVFPSENGLREEEALAYFQKHTPVSVSKPKEAALISALIKSMRASDLKAACFYLGYLIKAHVEVDYIYRRLMVFSSEDVGVRDVQAAVLIQSLWASAEKIGYPEASYGLYQAVTYLSKASKSRVHVQQMRWCDQNIDGLIEEISIPEHLKPMGKGAFAGASNLPKDFKEKL